MKLKRIILKDIENSPIFFFFHISLRDRCIKISKFVDNSCASFSSKNNFSSFFFLSFGWMKRERQEKFMFCKRLLSHYGRANTRYTLCTSEGKSVDLETMLRPSSIYREIVGV